MLGELARYPSIGLDALIARRPDVVFLPDEPWKFTVADSRPFEDAGIRTVGPFPGDLFTWHGARTAAGLRFLCDMSG